MILIYRPEDGEEKRWDLSKERATFAEAKAAEKAGNFKWAALQQELAEGNLEALQAALWVYLKREKPDLKYSDLEELSLEAVDVDYGDDEKAVMRAQLESDPSLSGEQRAAVLRMLGFSDEEAGKPEAPDPKAASAS